MPTFNWSHVLCLLLALALGYWLHARYPGLLTRTTAGTVTA